MDRFTRFLALVPGAAALLLSACSTPSSPPSPGGFTGAPGSQPLHCPPGFRTVVIDAGHGGHDSGARSSSTGMLEKNLALDVSRRVQSELKGRFQVVMMRDSDTFIDLDERVVRADRFRDGVLVSIHFNSGPSRISGPETFYWHPGSYPLAVRLQRNLSAAIPGESGSRGLVRRRLRLTRNPSIPCVLVECGYLSNPREAGMDADPRHRENLAHAIASAIRETAEYGDSGAGPLPPFIPSPPSRATDRRE